MSNTMLWNQGWKFTKETVAVTEGTSVLTTGTWEALDLPHTWNGTDGQDGGNDYHRGVCLYTKTLKRADLPQSSKVYMQFEGTNSSADLYVNGVKAAHHDGGYSTWRVNITELLQEENEIVVAVDNKANSEIYPQVADFTFYGGIYRDVTIICVDEAHFDLDYYGGPAIKVTPTITGANATVEVEVFLTGTTGEETLHYVIKDGETIIGEKTVSSNETKVTFEIENVHLWNGVKDPFLYTAEVVLAGEKELDARTTRFGCRTFEIDPERGFILNGVEYPLRGVSRHQDRPTVGNALSHQNHIDDMELICEMGATTIRLAHYQHDQFFYDLCDEKGMVLWAEIPYISKHMPGGRKDTIEQMKELITQNYNHVSIVVWGLSNEITMHGADDPDLIENHYVLNDLCHEMDPTRLTTIAAVSMCPIDAEYVRIPDVVSYNHYFGWYGGDTSMNGPWFDDFHAKYPNEPIGVSEYGCESLDWHTSKPEQGDYTEEYQAFYHEELIKQLFSRKYIWATHVWNMFDFAADARSEGGSDGMNNKGLVTFDRKYKKDSFFAYKAWLSDQPFVHICGKRYVDRVEDVTKVTVYSNLPEVELFANGVSLGKQTCPEHFFYFEVPNVGETTLKAVAGECTDESKLNKVDVFNEDYRMKETVGGDVINWFDITEVEGHFSINDKVAEVMDSEAGLKVFTDLMDSMKKGENGGMIDMSNISDDMMIMLKGFTVKRMLTMMGTMGGMELTKDQILGVNTLLNKVKK